jgi:hypothetical protein
MANCPAVLDRPAARASAVTPHAAVSANPVPSPAPPADQRGLVCRHCGCRHFRVIYTRPAWGGRIARRRECRNCGKRMTTWEKSAC